MRCGRRTPCAQLCCVTLPVLITLLTHCTTYLLLWARACALAWHHMCSPRSSAPLLRSKLLGPYSAHEPYLAIHLRLGGLEGETNDVVRFDQFKVRDHKEGTGAWEGISSESVQ